jgi:subtilisin family serine protease
MATSSRTYRTLIHIALAIIVLISSVSICQPVQAQSASTASFLVGFQPGATDAERQAVLEMLNVIPLRWIASANVVQVTPRNPDAVFASSALEAASPYITYIESDVIVSGDLAPNDPAFTSPSLVYGQTILEAPLGWNISTGISTTIIAILDSGLNPEHVEFTGRVLPGYDFINDDDAPLDDHGHGTHVAGIAAAALNNEQGAAGICPQCMILPVKVLDNANRGTWGTVAEGIYFAVDAGARVINLSLGASVSSRTLENAVLYAEEHDVIVVASAGNAASSTPYFPAALPYVVAVGATTDSDALWPLSNTGDHIDLTAPGYRVYSTYNNLDYAYMSGTSMASPFITGLVGLLASFNPALTGTEIIDFMTANADDLGDAGKDATFGYGRVNVKRAMVAANGGVAVTDPVEEPEEEPEEPEQPISPLPMDSSAAIFLPVVTRG